MASLILRRLVQLPLIVLSVYTITFALAWLIPGNPLENPDGRQSEYDMFHDYIDEVDKFNTKFDIVLIDPPYNSSVIQECLPLLKEYNLIDKNSLIFAETSKQETISVENFKVLDTKFYGKSKLTIMKLLDLSSIK